MSQRDHFLQIEQLRTSDSLILFHQAQVLIREEQFIWRPSELDSQLLQNSDLILLEEENGAAIIAVNTHNDLSQLLNAENQPLRSLLFLEDGARFALAGRASQLLDWYNSHRYCGSCGSGTVHHGSERAVVCEPCNHHYFPRINPCAIVLVTKGSQLLLARSSRFNSNYFSALAGFIEIGETPEQTVVREVKEEVGIDVDNVRYIKSQSWPFPSQLMLGFLADYKSGDIVPAPEEIEEADWYDVDKLPVVPSAKISVAGELIQYFVKHINSQQGKT